MSKLFMFLLLLGIQVQAQNMATTMSLNADAEDSLSTTPVKTSPNESYERPLLPNRMLFTQRIFWGANGLLRVMDIAPLTQEGREKEMKVRRLMLVSHQVTGYVTLAGLLMQGILGSQLNHASGAEYARLSQLQQTTATITNVAYGTTALLSLTAPPKIATDRKKSGGINLHKYLSIIHLTGIIATNVLAAKVPQNSELRPYRQAAAFTTLAAFAPALIALKF
ncbi:hypothetical protein [Spirosoma koreense]